MTNAATKSEYMTSAVPMAVGGAFRSAETGPIDTGKALMLKFIWSWARTMMINGSQETAAWAAPSDVAAVVEKELDVILQVLNQVALLRIQFFVP
jgi:hypothetical protein